MRELLRRRTSGCRVESGVLIMAGRVVLANAVVYALPFYTIQSVRLPASICEGLEKRLRRFIWGSSRDNRKISLVKWEEVCMARDHGGLSLTRQRTMNGAFLMKLS
ncbi:Uncharacterized mitochondrial protein AtMg00310 [Striga hermonthica]|uniref:Uncharacterized mitochondrial protein AtMg00310 n=1 Tax=Striga hermonthica TaxID=68872 RepID=A0A9N7RK50_STRHE|nr:Uncharacterized mitochondrial protein AtMg00310 [Striga hermonthica]